MRVVIDSKGSSRLEEAADFQRFSVSTLFPANALDRIAGLLGTSIVFETPLVAWVKVEALVRMAGPADDQWKSELDTMLEKVKPFGWFDEERGAVRAHVTWP